MPLDGPTPRRDDPSEHARDAGAANAAPRLVRTENDGQTVFDASAVSVGVVLASPFDWVTDRVQPLICS
jgi:hypothetical protein